jgi:hypothetical protein
MVTFVSLLPCCFFGMFFVLLVKKSDDADQVAESEFWSEIFSRMMPSNVSSHEPFSDFMYPLIESMDSDPYWLVQQQQQELAIEDDPVNSTTTSNGKVVGTIATTIYWRELIQNKLTEWSRGIVVVFENACKPSFSYQIL